MPGSSKAHHQSCATIPEAERHNYDPSPEKDPELVHKLGDPQDEWAVVNGYNQLMQELQIHRDEETRKNKLNEMKSNLDMQVREKKG